MTDLARLRELLGKATPGEWLSFEKHKYNESHVSVPIAGSTMKLALFENGIPTRNHADSKLIAAMKNALPALLTELEQYRNAEVLATYSRGDGNREWWTGGTWLYPGQSVVVVDAAKEAK